MSPALAISPLQTFSSAVAPQQTHVFDQLWLLPESSQAWRLEKNELDETHLDKTDVMTAGWEKQPLAREIIFVLVDLTSLKI